MVGHPPEYELSRVMTTGMSAPPMDAVRWAPLAPEKMAVATSAAMPTAGEPEAMKMPPATMLPPSSARLIWFLRKQAYTKRGQKQPTTPVRKQIFNAAPVRNE